MDLKTKMKLSIFCAVITISVLFSGCSDQGISRETYEDIKHQAYKEGYNDGYEEGRDKTIEDIQEEYDGGCLLFIPDEIYEQLVYFVDENNGFEYVAEEYVITVGEYLNTHRDEMTDEEIEAFLKVIRYCYDADWLTRQIVN